VLKNLKFPLIYVIESLLYLPLMAAFYAMISFVEAKPIASLDLQGKLLPATWEAAVPSHGKFLQGYLISNHPLAFSAIVVVLLSAALGLVFVQKAQVEQRKAAAPSGTRAHTIAHACAFAALAVIGFCAVNKFFGISAG
jgi:hypothetical protein